MIDQCGCQEGGLTAWVISQTVPPPRPIVSSTSAWWSSWCRCLHKLFKSYFTKCPFFLVLPTIWRTCWGRQIQEGSPSFVTCDLDCYGTKFQCDVGIICLLPFISTNLHPVSLQDGVFNRKVFNGEEYFILLHCQNILNIRISEYQNIHWRISCLKFTGSEGSDSPSHSPVKVQSVSIL